MYDPNAGTGQLPLLSRLLGGLFGATPGMTQAPGPQVSQPTTTNPQTGAPGSINSQFGFNMDTGKFLLGGLDTVGRLWAANKAYGLAKDQFNFQKDVTNTNLNNQIQSYNTSLEDRAHARAVLENRDPSTAIDYIDRNRLTR